MLTVRDRAGRVAMAILRDDRERVGQVAVHERAAGRDWEVTGSGFWQVHPGAAEALVDAVLAALEPRPGERVVDLYSGVGLFTGFLADAVGHGVRVVAVEGDRTAVGHARQNLGAGSPGSGVEVVQGTVAKVLAEGLVVDVEGAGADGVPRDESHLVVRAFRAACAELDWAPPGLRVVAENSIPQGRGMGSSAAAVVAGVQAVRRLG